ncbi:MAG: phospholipase A [Proteobacteria bacterium]|nr:phospholipase A [Pseudomonadota bacterium]
MAEDLSQSRDKMTTLEGQENLALLRYRPVYFLYGNPDTKAQISFKFLLIRTVPLYIGYSQLVFWRLNAKSRPFEDATYHPELFYRWNFPKSRVTTVDFGPWSHLSNGKTEEASRSVDETFVRVNSRWDFSSLTLLLSGTGSINYNEDETNRDLYLYRGPFEIQGSVINFFDLQQFIDKSEFNVRMFPGGRYGERWQHGGYEIGFNFRFGAYDVFPTFYLQYYQGFAESMINYNQFVRQFRAGISF